MRNEIIDEARTWIGTPFHHQQCLKGHGVDCVQFVSAVGARLNLCQRIPKEKSNYPRRPRPKDLINGMKQYLYELDLNCDSFDIGDIALIEWRSGLPMHLAIYSGNNSIIHATENFGEVIEMRLHNSVIINSFWRYIGLKHV